MISAKELQLRAQARQKTLVRKRRDPRYRRVLGRFVEGGYLTTNHPVERNKEPLQVADVLWAGDVEPRFLELLPALLVKQPSLFVDPRDLPDDLESAVRRLRRNLTPDTFRGIPGQALQRRLPEVGRSRTVPSRLKSFRLKPDDLRLLATLAQELGVTETEVVRRGLRALL